MRKTTIAGVALLLIALIMIFSISIWLGFPSANYNKIPLAVTGYFVGTLFLSISVPLMFGFKE